MESNRVTTDATTFTVYREEKRLAQFLMALLWSYFDHVHRLLLHRDRTCRADTALSEVLREEQKQKSLHEKHFDPQLVFTSSTDSSGLAATQKGREPSCFDFCNYWKKPRHRMDTWVSHLSENSRTSELSRNSKVTKKIVKNYFLRTQYNDPKLLILTFLNNLKHFSFLKESKTQIWNKHLSSSFQVDPKLVLHQKLKGLWFYQFNKHIEQPRLEIWGPQKWKHNKSGCSHHYHTQIYACDA